MSTSTGTTDIRPSGEPDRRTRRRLERRDRVFASAVELFVERGYDSTTMDDIAERADVARATVFNYFERKAAFLDEWAARRRRRAFAAVREARIDNGPVAEALNRYMRELAVINTGTREETVALMSAAVHSTNILGNPALGHELADYVRLGQRLGQVRADVDAGQAGRLLASGYFAALIAWIAEEPEPFDLQTELLAMLDLVLRGMLVGPCDRASSERRAG